VPDAVAAAGGSGRGDLFMVQDFTGVKGRVNTYTRLNVMPANDRAKFLNLSDTENLERKRHGDEQPNLSDTENLKRKRHGDEQPNEPIQGMKLVAAVGNAQGPDGKTEVGRADGGAASLVRQGFDAVVTLATMKAGLDPASLPSPDGPVINTAAATTYALAVRDGNGAPKQAGGGPAATPAAETSVVDLLLDPEPPANSAEHNEAAPMLAVELYKTFIPLALGDAGQAAHPARTSGSSLSDFIAADIETLFPGVLKQTTNESSSMDGFLLCTGQSANADDKLFSFCEQLHAAMVQEWTSTNTCLTREQLQNLARGSCVHEEIADLLMGVLCGVLGASYLDSSFQIRQGSIGRWSGHLKIDEHSSAKALVLACTFSAQVEAGAPKFVSRFDCEQTLAPFSSVLWLKAGDKHFTTVRMDLKNTDGPDTTTKIVEVQLADSNCARAPELNTKFRDCLMEVSKQLFPGAEFKEIKGLKLPPQNSFNDCLFHTAYYQAHVINPLMEDGTIKFRPRPGNWQRDAARLRSYFLLLVYREMQIKGAALQDLSEAYAEWNRDNRAAREVRSATLRSADALPALRCAHALLAGLPLIWERLQWSG
jgi:hypothetical protein